MARLAAVVMVRTFFGLRDDEQLLREGYPIFNDRALSRRQNQGLGWYAAKE